MSKTSKRNFKYEIGSTVKVNYQGRGKIIDRCFDDSYLPYLIEFDKWNDGHDGNTNPHDYSEKKALGKKDHCWWVDEEDIKLISKPTTKTKYTTKYKPGDEVIVVSSLRGRYTMADGTNEMWVTDQMKTKAGKAVKIKSVTKTGKYMIEGSIFPWVDGMFEKKIIDDKFMKVDCFGVRMDAFDLAEASWTLTIEGIGDKTTATYTDVDGKTITKTVSRYHGDEFDVRNAVDAVVKKVLPTEKKTYTVAGVIFERGGEVYNYLVNDIKVFKDMVVVVPVGKHNTLTHAVVKSVGTYTEDTSPYPISKMKTVEKVEDWDGWKLVCVESDHPFWTEGKIYRVVDGKWFDDEGDCRTMNFQYRTAYNKATKEFDLNGSRFKRVIED